VAGSTFGLSAHGTKTQQEANLRGKSQGTKSLDTKPQATHLASKTTTLPDTQLSTPGDAGRIRDEDVEDDEGQVIGELNARLACLRDISCSGCQLCQGPAKTGPPAKPKSTDNLSVKDGSTIIEHTNQDPFQGHQTDIHLCTPKGENVAWQDVKWERNPYAEACQDSSDLLGIVPGHYLLQASNTAEVLCALVQTDLHSQFYKTAPASETKAPGYSLGTDRVTKIQVRSATRLQVLEAKKKEVNATISSPGPTPTPRSSQSPKQGKSTEEDEVDEDETTYDPVDKRIEVPPRDSSLFYSNGNPKPISTGRLLI